MALRSRAWHFLCLAAATGAPDAEALYQRGVSVVSREAPNNESAISPKVLIPSGLPHVTAENYWMFNHARHRSPAAVESTVRAMMDYVAAAGAFPAFAHMGLNSSKVHGSTTVVFRQLRGALAMLKRDLVIHQKALLHALYEIHRNVPPNLETTDASFQGSWKASAQEIIDSIQRAKLSFDSVTAGEICGTASNFLTDLSAAVTNYTEILDGAIAILPGNLPDKNPWINATAMEARRNMYNTSRVMMHDMSEQVKAGMADFLLESVSCHLIDDPTVKVKVVEEHHSFARGLHGGPGGCGLLLTGLVLWLDTARRLSA